MGHRYRPETGNPVSVIGQGTTNIGDFSYSRAAPRRAQTIPRVESWQARSVVFRQPSKRVRAERTAAADGAIHIVNVT